MNPKKQWSNSDIVFPMDVLCGYIHEQGRLETTNPCLSLLSLSHSSRWWNYHNESGGNLQNFLDNAMIPNMQKRVLLLPNSCIGRFIVYVIRHIKEKYPSETAKSSLGENMWA